MSKKTRKAVKNSTGLRDEEHRRAEVDILKLKVSELGLTKEFSEVARAIKIMDEFVSEGTSADESFKLPGLKRNLRLQLCNRSTSPCNITLSYDPYV